MSEVKLQIIKGGRDENLASLYSFQDASVTNTRLMGVLGMHIHWLVTEREEHIHLHQFMYFDIEELGLDSIVVYTGSDPLEIERTTLKCFGGLGGQMQNLTEREARYLANYFISDTLRRGEPLPAKLSELDYITQIPVELTKGEKQTLAEKFCVPVQTDFGLVNYYLMRLFGKDEQGAAYLVREGTNPHNFSKIAPDIYSCFLMNNITEFINEDGSKSYMSESLIENERGHFLIFSEIKVQGGKIFSAHKKSEIKISDSEASLKLMREEVITVYNVECDPELFALDFEDYALGMTIDEYDAGTMYMKFRENNKHVEQAKYRLNDDVKTVYFLTQSGQLILASYSIPAIVEAELGILQSMVGDNLSLMGKYRFANGVIFDFAVSGYDDFIEYLQNFEE